MTVQSSTDVHGRSWIYDPDVVYAIVRAAVRARIMRNRSRVVTENPAWYLPTTYYLDTNWQGYRPEMEAEAARYWQNAQLQLRRAPDTFFGSLIGLVNDAINDNNWHRNTSQDCMRRSSANIGRVVDNWETALTATRVVRDASATILIVTAGVLVAPVGAGAAAAASSGIGMGGATTMLATGSVMRGAFTYQDTGNVGSAMINAAGSFTVGMIGLGGASATLTSAEAATVLVIGASAQGVTSGGQALVEGKSMEQAAAAALIGAGSQALGGVVGNRMGNLGFWTQVGTGTLIDVTGNQISNRVVDAIGAPATPPAARGNIDFLGLPAGASEAYVRQFAMRPR